MMTIDHTHQCPRCGHDSPCGENPCPWTADDAGCGCVDPTNNVCVGDDVFHVWESSSPDPRTPDEQHAHVDAMSGAMAHVTFVDGRRAWLSVNGLMVLS